MKLIEIANTCVSAIHPIHHYHPEAQNQGASDKEGEENVERKKTLPAGIVARTLALPLV